MDNGKLPVLEKKGSRKAATYKTALINPRQTGPAGGAGAEAGSDTLLDRGCIGVLAPS